MIKGKYFKHPARKRRWEYLIMDRFYKHPCWYCPLKLRILLIGKCDYAPHGGTSMLYDRNNDKNIGCDQICVHLYSPVGTKYYKWEFRFKEHEKT